LLLAAAGCAQNNPFLAQQQQTAQQQQLMLAEQGRELHSKAQTLDADNQQLSAMLAQSRQQVKLLEDQLAATREQMAALASQAERYKENQLAASKKAEAILSSTRRKAGATITANNSLAEVLPAANIPGVEVRRDGDVIRIELPADDLFDPGTAQLRRDASRTIDAVAAEVARDCGQHFIGIEGHTDNDPVRSTGTADHELSTARATAIYRYLASTSRLRPNQLFIAGHGPNHPVVPNDTPAGRQRNRRVELVVYPEQIGRGW
jgi:flagellar motor protein MotB